MNRQVIAILIIYTIGYIYSLIFAPAIVNKKSGILGCINKFHKESIITINGCEPLTQFRGDNYYISEMSDELKSELNTCLLTTWGALHMLLYAFIGYFAPDYFWETFAVGVAFECYEAVAFNCEDPLDVVWNSIGFMVGKSCRNLCI